MKDLINNGRDRLSNLVSFLENIIIEIIILAKKIDFFFKYHFQKNIPSLTKI